MTNHERDVEKYIATLARKYAYKLPPGSKYELEDLMQEGWLVYWKVITNRRLDKLSWEGSNIPPLIKVSIRNKFKNIVRMEHWPRQKAVSYDSEAVESATVEESTSPERMAMLMEALEALLEVNNDLAFYLIFGGSETEFGFIRYCQRQRKHARWSMNGMRFRWTPELVKLVFGFDVTSFELCGYI